MQEPDMRPVRPKQLLADLKGRAVTAQEFGFVNRPRRVRAEPGRKRRGPRPAPPDGKGQAPTTNTLGCEWLGLMPADQGGASRAFPGVTNDAARPGMADKKGKQRAFMGVSSDTPSRSLHGAKQRVAWTPVPGL